MRLALFLATVSGLLCSTSSIAFANFSQVSLAPIPSYSSLDGVNIGVKAGVGFKFANDWEVTVDGSIFGGSSYTAKLFEVGALYNAEPSLLRSWIFGVGAGISNEFDSGISSGFIYGRGGYRWLLSTDYQVSYAPYLELQYSHSEEIIDVEFANFCITF